MSVVSSHAARTSLRTLFLGSLLALMGLTAAGAAQAATTYYVRTDGGDATQCTGRGDAAYPGSGTAQNCAWKHIYYALPTSGALRIAGGDTLIIGAGSYMVGWGAPGAAGGRCYQIGSYDCYLPPIPSGPSATAKTRILGKGHDTGCTVPPKLWGTERVSTMINLEGSSNIEVGCLEITDQSDCVEFHSNTAIRCKRDATPFGQWAGTGVSARASSNVWLHDLNIHGLANRGLVGGGLSNWTLDRVKINANGWAGWDGDIGTGSSNSGAIVLRQVEIAWNGCGERWQTGVIHGCWAQTAGGYGDGIGTATTGGQWLIEDSYVHHNTSDGIDLLYVDGAATSSVTVRRTYAAGNAGNQIKTKGNTTIENSIAVGNCSYFLNRDSMTSDDQCRALGNTVSIGLLAGNVATIRHNTIIGEGDCLILSGGGTSTSQLKIQNNALIGQLDWRSNLQGNVGELTCGHYVDGGSAVTTFTKNLFWNVKASQCPTGSVCGVNPKLANMTMASFDATPQAGSPLIDSAVLVGTISEDFYWRPRPVGTANDIGAVETVGAGKIMDYDGDGKSDLLWRNLSTGSDVVWRSGNYTTPLGISAVTSQNWKIVGTGDFNGDGRSDVLWRESTTGGNSIWLSGNSATPQSMVAITDNAWKIAGIGDFNGDGKADIFWRHDVSGANVIWKSGNYYTPQSTTDVADLNMKIVGIGDFDGDGRSDVLWRHSGNGGSVIWKGGGAAETQSVKTVADLAWRVVGIGDFDADGKSDLVWRHDVNGANTIWKGAVSNTQISVSQVSDPAWKIAAVGDFDGDGYSDLVWRHTLFGSNTVWRSANSSTALAIGAVADPAWAILK